MQRTLRPVLAVALALGLAACGGDDGGSEDGGEITVLAASSLTESFTTLKDQFEKEHPGVEVKLAFDSSATLAAQAVEGAPADVLATADEATMADAVDGDALDGDPTTFATNSLTLVVPVDNPAGITSFADIDSAGVDYVVCVPTAPCGKSSASVLGDQGIGQDPVSEEIDVKAVLQKVVSGEADAGLVYTTDATSAGNEVKSFEAPGADELLQTYPIGLLRQTQDKSLAQEFIDLATSEAGQQVLQDAGFGQP